MQSNWFNIREIEHGVFLIEEPEHVQSYLVKGARQAALIDTGMGFRDIGAAISPLVETPLVVFNTHWHFDHIGGNALFQQIGIARVEQHLLTHPLSNAMLMALYIRPSLEQGIPFPEQFAPERYEIHSPSATFAVHDGDAFDLGGRILTAIATPGHTHGSFSFLDDRTQSLFCGDALYRGTLYAHFLDSDLEQYIHSLQKLLAYREKIKRFFTAHNEYALPPSFLDPVLEAFRTITKGVLAGQTVREHHVLVTRYEFDDFAVLAKSAGSPGVDLLEWAYPCSGCNAGNGTLSTGEARKHRPGGAGRARETPLTLGSDTL